MIESGYWLCTLDPHGRFDARQVMGLRLDGTVVFASDGEIDSQSEWPGDPQAMVVNITEDEHFNLAEGVAERVADDPTLRRFAAEFEAKYGYEVELGEPDLPIYTIRTEAPAEPAALLEMWTSLTEEGLEAVA